VDSERRRAENSIANLVRAQQSQAANPKIKTLLQAKILEATQEEATIRAALAKIHEIRNIRNERRIQVSPEYIKTGLLLKTILQRLEMLAIRRQFVGER